MTHGAQGGDHVLIRACAALLAEFKQRHTPRQIGAHYAHGVHMCVALGKHALLPPETHAMPDGQWALGTGGSGHSKGAV